MTGACPICGGETRVTIAAAYDDRYGYPGSFDIRRCARCGHHHVPATFTEDELSALYSHYYPRGTFNLDKLKPPPELTWRAAWLRGEYASAYRWVPRGVRVLDVGCGFGQTLLYHKARGSEAYGIDADENLLRVGERFGLNVQVGLFKADRYEPASFDYVTLDQVVEHAIDPILLLRDVHEVLRPGGIVVLSTPNARSLHARLFGRRWINWHVPYHLHHFTKTSLRRAVEAAGFEMRSLRTLTNSAWSRYQLFHVLTRPPEGIPSPFWDAARSPRRVRRRVRTVAAISDRLRLPEVGTRLEDVLGVGDNLVSLLAKPEAS